MDRVPQGVRKMLGMAYAISPAPARRRPFWLTLACALVWVEGAALLVLLLPLVAVVAMGFAFAAGRPLASLSIFVPAAAAAVLLAATVGLWRMRRWGAVLLSAYVGMELIRILLGVPLPVALLPAGLPLVDTYAGQATASAISTAHNLFMGLFWLASLVLWRRGSLAP